MVPVLRPSRRIKYVGLGPAETVSISQSETEFGTFAGTSRAIHDLLVSLSSPLAVGRLRR